MTAKTDVVRGRDRAGNNIEELQVPPEELLEEEEEEELKTMETT